MPLLHYPPATHTETHILTCMYPHQESTLKQGELGTMVCRSGSEPVGLLEQYVYMHGQAQTHIYSHTHLNREAERQRENVRAIFRVNLSTTHLEMNVCTQ